MPSWDQVMQLLDKENLCGITFVLLVIHMLQEERIRYRYLRQIREDVRKEE